LSTAGVAVTGAVAGAAAVGVAGPVLVGAVGLVSLGAGLAAMAAALVACAVLALPGGRDVAAEQVENAGTETGR